jgi:hypothetical protein
MARLTVNRLTDRWVKTGHQQDARHFREAEYSHYDKYFMVAFVNGIDLKEGIMSLAV